MSGRHPNHDLLADLAAEVLPESESRIIEAHVVGCARCADLLADAERVRQLLRTPDPGPMPTQVWDRIVHALDQQAAGAQSRPGRSADLHPDLEADPPPPQRVPEVAASSDPEPDPALGAPTAQWQRFVAEDRADDNRTEGDTDGDTDGDPDAASSPFPGERSDEAVTSAPRRRGAASTLRSRRQIRSEDRTMSLLRYARPLGIAAAVLILAGLTGLAVVRLPLGEEQATTAEAGGAGISQSAGEADRAAAVPEEQADAGAAGDGAATVTLATGTDYTEADVGPRAVALIPNIGVSPGPSDLAAQSSSASPTRTPDSAPSFAGNAMLTDPVRLAECLAEINSDDVQPIVVDFARYEGQDAAIIVLAARDGGYEVWAVTRTCGPGDRSTLAVVNVPSS